jgi:hypothetical protein
MNLPKYIQEKLTWKESFQFWLLQRRVRTSMKKMDHHIKMGDEQKQKACKYEDLLYKSDDALVGFIHKMSMKYA